MIPVTVFTLLVLKLTEGYLLASHCIQSCIFFLFCGWVVTIDKEKSEHSTKDSRKVAIANICCAVVVSFGCVLVLSYLSIRRLSSKEATQRKIPIGLKVLLN